MSRFTAYTLDGTKLFEFDHPSTVANYLSRKLTPYIGYTYDSSVLATCRYTTWEFDESLGIATVGTLHKSYDDVLDWWKKQKADKRLQHVKEL